MKLLFALLLFSTVFATAAPASAAPLSCDSELQTFSTSGKLMRVTGKYIYKLPNNAAPDNESELDDGVETYIDGTLAAVTQLRSAPSSGASIILGVDQGSIWRVTGDPLCVEEPQFNDAVTIYVPVESYANGSLGGWFVESRNWKNINLRDLTINAPDEILKRLSVYYLEPQVVNPQIQFGSLDFAAAEPEPVCPHGGISHVQIGAPAKRYTYTEQNSDIETPWNIEFDRGVWFGQSMPLFESAFIELYVGPVETGEWYDFLYVDFIADTSPYAVPPGALSSTADVQILDGPVCGNIHYESRLNDTQGVTLIQMFDLATITWYRVRVTQGGQQYEGWFPENIRWVAVDMNHIEVTVSTRYDFTAYFLGPVPSDDEDQNYIDTWLIDDLAFGEPGTKKLATLGGFSRLAVPGEACSLSLATRLDRSPRARVIVPGLNMRALPTTESLPMIGLGEGTIVQLNGMRACADGYRWWGASVSGGALGTRVSYGWVAEHDSAIYYLEPVAGSGPGTFIARPTATLAPTSTPMPVTNPTLAPQPTATPTPRPTDPIPG